MVKPPFRNIVCPKCGRIILIHARKHVAVCECGNSWELHKGISVHSLEENNPTVGEAEVSPPNIQINSIE